MDVYIHLVMCSHCVVTKNLTTQLALFNNSLSNWQVICHGPIHGYFNSQRVMPTWYVFIEKLGVPTHINMQIYFTILVILSYLSHITYATYLLYTTKPT
jgi:hypothetical protein